MSPEVSLPSMWNKVPRRLLTYWGRNVPLSWMRYMTVKSFTSLNPDWKVEVLTPQCPVKGNVWDSREFETPYKGKDWFHALEAIPRVKVRWVDFSIVAHLLRSEVHRSDYIRYSELAGGGVWSDMDVLYLKPIEDLEFSYMPEGEDIGGAVCWCRKANGRGDGHSIGILVGTEGSRFWARVFDKAWDIIHEKEITDYQALGRSLLDNHFPWEESGPMANIAERCIYPLKTRALSRLYQQDTPNKVVKKSVGVHWYGGHCSSGQAERGIVPGDLSTFSLLARRSL